jgi:dienelactone hydrolase
MQLKRIRVRAHGVVGALYLPESAGPHPAVVVLGGSEGGAPERAAAQLASGGFAAMAVAYFGVDPLPRELEEIPLEYFAGAFAWLAQRPEVSVGSLSVIGRSRGGELALLLAAHFPEVIKAVVAYVPSHVVWQSAPSSRLLARATARSSWTFGGRPVPFVPAASVTAEDREEFASFHAGRPIAFRPQFERAMLQRDAVAEAAIPIERITGPVLLLSAGDDQLWPSRTLCELAVQRLEQHGHRFAHRHVCYEAAGHLLGIPGTMYGPHAPSFPTLIMGGTPAADVQASRDSWPMVVDFLHSFLSQR